MPLHRGAVFRRFHVQLAALVPDPRTDEAGDDVQDRIGAGDLVEEGMDGARLLQPPQPRRGRRVSRLQVEDVRMIRDGTRVLHEFLDHRSRLLNQVEGQHALYGEKAAFLIGIDLLLAQHHISLLCRCAPE